MEMSKFSLRKDHSLTGLPRLSTAVGDAIIKQVFPAESFVVPLSITRPPALGTNTRQARLRFVRVTPGMPGCDAISSVAVTPIVNLSELKTTFGIISTVKLSVGPVVLACDCMPSAVSTLGPAFMDLTKPEALRLRRFRKEASSVGERIQMRRPLAFVAKGVPKPVCSIAVDERVSKLVLTLIEGWPCQ